MLTFCFTGALGGPPSSAAPQPSPRGVKRSRSPENNYDISQGDPGDGMFHLLAMLYYLHELPDNPGDRN